MSTACTRGRAREGSGLRRPTLRASTRAAAPNVGLRIVTFRRRCLLTLPDPLIHEGSGFYQDGNTTEDEGIHRLTLFGATAFHSAQGCESAGKSAF